MTNPETEFSVTMLARLSEKFGPPRLIPHGSDGAFHRWIIARRSGASIYLTLNFPEQAGIAYVLISDPALSIEPVTTLILRNATQVEDVIQRIERRL